MVVVGRIQKSGHFNSAHFETAVNLKIKYMDLNQTSFILVFMCK